MSPTDLLELDRVDDSGEVHGHHGQEVEDGHHDAGQLHQLGGEHEAVAHRLWEASERVSGEKRETTHVISRILFFLDILTLHCYLRIGAYLESLDNW